MRTIDSVLSLCRKYKRELTIVWNVDTYLNCLFEDLFETLASEHIRIINIRANSPFVWKGRILKLPKLGKKIIGIKSERRISNDSLFDLYQSKNYLGRVELVSEVDDLFYSKVSPVVTPLFETNDHVYIESCYRMYPHENYYSSFKPVTGIQDKIDRMVVQFKNTVGLHIRRSDHTTSKEFSTTEKFVNIIQDELKHDSSTSFFVCTDSAETLHELISLFGDKILFNEIKNYDRNNSGAIKDAVLDVYCLAKTKKIYGSYFSSFSQVAADIGKVPEISVR